MDTWNAAVGMRYTLEWMGVNGGDLDVNPRMSEILDLIQALLDPLVLFKCLGSNFEDPDALEFAK